MVFLTGTHPANNNSSWVPSRDWHKYFSGQGHQSQPKPTIPTSARAPSPSSPPQTHWPSYLNKSTDLHLTKPPDELISLKLPSVNFCSGDVPEEESFTKIHPSISDLCEEDKRKIALLVEELAK